MAISRRDLANRINKRLEIRDADLVELIVGAVGDEILQVLEEGKVVQLNNLGRFQTRYKDNLKNPKTEELMPPMFIPKFSFAHAFRTKIKAKKADYFVNEKAKEDAKDATS